MPVERGLPPCTHVGSIVHDGAVVILHAHAHDGTGLAELSTLQGLPLNIGRDDVDVAVTVGSSLLVPEADSVAHLVYRRPELQQNDSTF